MSFPLSDQPVFGEWFIFAEMQGQTYNKSFEVQKYGKLLTPSHLDPNPKIFRVTLWNIAVLP